MILSLSKKHLIEYVLNQLNAFFPDAEPVTYDYIDEPLSDSLDRLSYCFKHIKRKYYQDENGGILFNHLNGDHYSMILYLLSNTIWQKHGSCVVANKIFMLNKMLHGIDVFYEVILPEIFMFIHPLGTVLGRATYNDYFMVYQGCTVGSVVDHGYPKLSRGVVMYSNSSILGDCDIGQNVVVGANSYLVNTDIKNDSVVVGQYPDLKILQNKNDNAKKLFGL